MNVKYFTTLILMILGLVGTLTLELGLSPNGLELLIIFASVIVGFISVYGMITKKDWTKPLLSVLFAVLTLNAVYLYNATNANTLVFLVTLLVSVYGLGSVALEKTPKKAKKKSTRKKAKKSRKKRRR